MTSVVAGSSGFDRGERHREHDSFLCRKIEIFTNLRLSMPERYFAKDSMENMSMVGDEMSPQFSIITQGLVS